MKYIFLDIDGTLFCHEQNCIPNSAMKAISIAKSNGHKLFLCTGRSLGETKNMLNLDVDGYVFCAGAVVYADKKRIFENLFNEIQINELIDICVEYNLGYCLDGDAGAYMSDYAKEFVGEMFFNGQYNDKNKELALCDLGFFNLDYRHKQDGIGKICVYGNSLDNYEELSKKIGKNFNITCTYMNHENSLFAAEITHLGVDKAKGMEVVLNYFNEDFSNTVGIGDSPNDVEMLKAANISVAMGNANLDVKQHADFVTTNTSDDGIYNAFKKIGII